MNVQPDSEMLLPIEEKRFAGCIVLYNPNDDLLNNIKSYLNQLDRLYVIDNSDKRKTSFTDALDTLGSKIHYIFNNGNLGIAKALNIGCQLAFEHGFQWLLTMDQDSFFANTAFFQIAHKYLNNHNAIISASYTNSYDQWTRPYDNYFDEIHYAITSGNLINLKAWDDVGGFETKLFIDEVDHDFCLKLRQKKYAILVSKDVYMKHQIGETYQQSNIKENKKVELHSPLRYYYMARNVSYVCKKFFFSDFKFVAARLYYLFKILVKIILIYPNKWTYLKFYWMGLHDFMFSKYGNYYSR